MGQTNTLGELSQNVPTIAGQTYLLSFWLTNPNNALGATPNAFEVQWEGETLYRAVDLPFQKWTNLQFTVTATNSGSRLEFDFQDDPYYLGLDDVSVKLVVLAAAPSLRSIVQNPTTFNFSFATTPGATYQAQYKTNLAQSDWINLGGPTFSETNVLQFSDPDTADYPQKFYRLLLVH